MSGIPSFCLQAFDYAECGLYPISSDSISYAKRHFERAEWNRCPTTFILQEFVHIGVGSIDWTQKNIPAFV